MYTTLSRVPTCGTIALLGGILLGYAVENSVNPTPPIPRVSALRVDSFAVLPGVPVSAPSLAYAVHRNYSIISRNHRLQDHFDQSASEGNLPNVKGPICIVRKTAIYHRRSRKYRKTPIFYDRHKPTNDDTQLRSKRLCRRPITTQTNNLYSCYYFTYAEVKSRLVNRLEPRLYYRSSGIATRLSALPPTAANRPAPESADTVLFSSTLKKYPENTVAGFSRQSTQTILVFFQTGYRPDLPMSSASLFPFAPDEVMQKFSPSFWMAAALTSGVYALVLTFLLIRLGLQNRLYRRQAEQNRIAEHVAQLKRIESRQLEKIKKIQADKSRLARGAFNHSRAQIAAQLHKNVKSKLEILLSSAIIQTSVRESSVLNEILEFVIEIHDQLRVPDMKLYRFELILLAHIQEVKKRFQVPEIELLMDPPEPVLPEYLKGDVYEIFGILLDNSCQHAKAGRIQVNVTSTKELFSLAVIDNGIGFDVPEDFETLWETGHFGIWLCKYLSESMNGRLTIKSAFGHGTACVLTIADPMLLNLEKTLSALEHSYASPPGT